MYQCLITLIIDNNEPIANSSRNTLNDLCIEYVHIICLHACSHVGLQACSCMCVYYGRINKHITMCVLNEGVGMYNIISFKAHPCIVSDFRDVIENGDFVEIWAQTKFLSSITCNRQYHNNVKF